jgi:hypothetical protein
VPSSSSQGRCSRRPGCPDCRLVGVAVVRVGVVRVEVRHRLMPMAMGVRLARWIVRAMRMLVVSVVPVGMGMR